MLQVTRWSPDTCGCVLEYEWDDAVPADARTHTATSVVTRCAEHSKMKLQSSDHFAQVLEENTGKNMAFEVVKSKVASLDVADFKYSFDKDRKLVVDVDHLAVSAAEKLTLTAELNSKLGSGKASIK